MNYTKAKGRCPNCGGENVMVALPYCLPLYQVIFPALCKDCGARWWAGMSGAPGNAELCGLTYTLDGRGEI